MVIIVTSDLNGAGDNKRSKVTKCPQKTACQKTSTNSLAIFFSDKFQFLSMCLRLMHFFNEKKRKILKNKNIIRSKQIIILRISKHISQMPKSTMRNNEAPICDVPLFVINLISICPTQGGGEKSRINHNSSHLFNLHNNIIIIIPFTQR